MRVFIDSADVNEIREARKLGLADGVTTNPTLIAKAGVDLERTIRTIADIVEGPVNAEVTATTLQGILEEGRRFHAWAPNVYVKIPLNHEGLVACRALAAEGIRSTMTLVFSPAQAILAAKARACYICPFIGRLDDTGYDGVELIRTISKIYREDIDFSTQVLAASVRSPVHVVEAARAGADAVTISFSLIRQMIQHPLTERGIAQFLKDAEKTMA